jgi:hypothetical protein
MFLTTVSIAAITLPPELRPWDYGPGYFAAIAVIGSITSFLRSIVLARGDWRLVNDEHNRQLMSQVGLSLLKAVSDASRVEYYKLGVHIFMYDPGFLQNRIWLRKKKAVFRRQVRLRWPADERHSGLPLRPGVGVVGIAFSEKKIFVQPIGRDFGRYERDEDSWNELPRIDRGGLNHAQLLGCRGYGYVAACPIFDTEGEGVGCVAVDGPAPDEGAMLDANDKIREAMLDAVAAIRHKLYFIN